MILALEMYRSLPRFVASRALGPRMPGGFTLPTAPLRLVNREEPRPAHSGWARVRTRLSGICGSDLGAITGSTSLYFSALVSMPFVPGHEVVGELVEDCDDMAAGTRVVLDPVLSCAARGVEACTGCAAGATNRCDRITVGHVSPGLQTGYCADTGGGWSGVLMAHRSQLHAVSDGMSDERAVLVEPLACAVHTALRAGVRAGDNVLVSGAGAVGLFVTLALRELTVAGRVTVVAKHARQRELAQAFGATEVVAPSEVFQGIRRRTRAFTLTPDYSSPFLLGGVDIAIDAVGSKHSVETSLRATRAGGKVVLSGMPGPGVDLSPVWFRELDVVGSYASAAGEPGAGGRPAFEVAMELAASAPLDGVVAATYPLNGWREALDHAQTAGRLGSVKVAFDPRRSA
jgi:threonine dehydrogenase-like Zn-dependent dehydrogenase